MILCGQALKTFSARKYINFAEPYVIVLTVAGLGALQLLCVVVGIAAAGYPQWMQTIWPSIVPRKIVQDGRWAETSAFIAADSDPAENLTSQSGLSTYTELVFQLPLRRGCQQQHFSQWERDIGIWLQLDYLARHVPASNAKVGFQVSIGYFSSSHADDKNDSRNNNKTLIVRSKGGGGKWKTLMVFYYFPRISCATNSSNNQTLYTNCSAVPVLYRSAHLRPGTYLLAFRKLHNNAITLTHVNLLTTALSAGFMQARVALKSPMLLLLIACLYIWWRRRPQCHQRREHSTVLELAVALKQFNLPLELLATQFDMPYIATVDEIRRDVVYSALVNFWLRWSSELLWPTHKPSPTLPTPDETGGEFCCKITAPIITLAVLAMLISGDVMWARDPKQHHTADALWLAALCGSIAISAGALLVAGLRVAGRRPRCRRRLVLLFGLTPACVAFTVAEAVLSRLAPWRRPGGQPSLPPPPAALCTGVYGMWSIYCMSAIFCLQAPPPPPPQSLPPPSSPDLPLQSLPPATANNPQM